MNYSSHLNNLTDFAKDWDFSQCSPKYPRSNGLAERTVGIGKGIFTKAKAAGTDPYRGILEYRTTPLTEMDYSPRTTPNPFEPGIP